MSSEWVTDTGAVEYLRTLLVQAGIPLELDVAAICKAFCESVQASALYREGGAYQNFDIFSEQVVYGPDAREGAYREVDQVVRIYGHFTANRRTEVGLELFVPIECKYRANVEYFAFPSSDDESHFGFPIYGEFLHADHAYLHLVKRTYGPIASVHHANIALVEFKDGKTPLKVRDEELIYKAAGALYDYVQMAVLDRDDYDEDDDLSAGSELFERFRNAQEGQANWWAAIRPWVRSVSAAERDSLNQSYAGWTVPVSAFLPVVCVNGPIYRVHWNATGGIGTFEEIPCCVTAIRKHQWPGMLRWGIAKRTRTAPVILTNSAHLGEVLSIALRWLDSIRTTVQDPIWGEYADSWGWQDDFVRRVVRHYAPQAG